MPTFEQVQEALEACMKAEPPQGEECALSHDSNQIANVFAEMLYFKETERPLESFKPKQREAFERWQAAKQAA